jgi:VanZ family protein
MFLKHNALGIIWALFILVLCGIPGDQFKDAKHEHLDKVIHIILFGVLFLLLVVGFIKQRAYGFLRSSVIPKVSVICVVYGIMIELAQWLIFTGRSLEVSDVLANAVGVGFGLGIFYLVYGRASYT